MLGNMWKQAIDAYGTKCPTIIVPPTLDKDFILAAGAYERNYGVTDPVGLYVGHVGKRKGVIDLLDALFALKRAGKPARMVIVGPEQRQGDWETVMIRHKELQLQDVVEFTGPLMGAALLERYQRADYLVLPSYIEGLPVVFLEAGAFGLPVIGTPVGAIEDLLRHDKNALLVAPGAVEELTRAIDRLRSSAVERERLGRQLRKDVAKYHPDIICGQITAALQLVLSHV